MNEDHSQNMVEMCRGLYDFTPATAKMTALDATGFHIETTSPDRTVFFSFGHEIDSSLLKKAVIDVLRKARKASA